MFLNVSRSATKTVQTVQIGSWRSQNVPQEAPRSGLGRPRKAQEASRQPQEPPGASQERPQSRPKSASERPWRPNEAHMASKSPPEASWTSFWSPRGTMFRLQGVVIFIQLETFRRACSKPPCVQSLCKHTSSIARRACVTTTCGITSTCGLVRRRTAGQ